MHYGIILKGTWPKLVINLQDMFPIDAVRYFEAVFVRLELTMSYCINPSKATVSYEAERKGCVYGLSHFHGANLAEWDWSIPRDQSTGLLSD